MSQSGTGAATQPLLTSATVVAPTSGFGSPTTTTTIDAQGNVNWVGGAWYVPLPVSAGDVIGTVTVVVRDNGPNNGHSLDGNNVLANLISRTAAGDTSRAFASSNGSGSQQTLTLAPSGGYTVQVGDEMLLEMHGLTGGANPAPSTVPSMTGAMTASPIQSIAATMTLQVPISYPGVSMPASITFSASTGGRYVAPISIPVSSRITRVRAVILDSSGPTKLVVGLREVDGNGNNFVAGAGPESAGNGTKQKVASAVMSEVVTSDVNYGCEALITTGTGTCSIHSCEVDYQPHS